MKKITVLLVCLLCAGGILLAGCGSKAKETLEDYRASGIEELQNGNYAKAVADFEQALSESDKKLSEEETDTMLYLALAQYKNGDYEGAVKSYKAIMSADDNDYRPYYLRGCVYLKQEDVDAAKEDFAMALNLEGDSLELYISIYENLREAGEEAAAGKLMEGALLVKPADADDMARYGYLQYLLGDVKQAQETLQEAAADSKLAVLYQGIAAATGGDLKAAEGYFDTYAAVSESDGEGLAKVGTAALNSGAYDAAIRYFQAAAGQLSDSDDAYRTARKNLVSAYEYKGDYEMAAEVLKEYLQSYPDDAGAQKELIFVETRQ